jgi:hypothetical protein
MAAAFVRPFRNIAEKARQSHEICLHLRRSFLHRFDHASDIRDPRHGITKWNGAMPDLRRFSLACLMT